MSPTLPTMEQTKKLRKRGPKPKGPGPVLYRISKKILRYIRAPIRFKLIPAHGNKKNGTYIGMAIMVWIPSKKTNNTISSWNKTLTNSTKLRRNTKKSRQTTLITAEQTNTTILPLPGQLNTSIIDTLGHEINLEK